MNPIDGISKVSHGITPGSTLAYMILLKSKDASGRKFAWLIEAGKSCGEKKKDKTSHHFMAAK